MNGSNKCALCGIAVLVDGAEYRQTRWTEVKGIHAIEWCKVFALIKTNHTSLRDSFFLVMDAHECNNAGKHTRAKPMRTVPQPPLQLMTDADREWAASVIEAALAVADPSPKRERAVSALLQALRAPNGPDAHDDTGARKAEATG